MVGLRNQNHTLNLAIFRAEICVECESCGYQIPMLMSEIGDLPEYVECSRCASERREAFRQKKRIEAHSIRLEDLVNLPPVIHIDTRDLPGFTRDDLAKKIGQTLELFKK